MSCQLVYENSNKDMAESQEKWGKEHKRGTWTKGQPAQFQAPQLLVK